MRLHELLRLVGIAILLIAIVLLFPAIIENGATGYLFGRAAMWTAIVSGVITVASALLESLLPHKRLFDAQRYEYWRLKQRATKGLLEARMEGRLNVQTITQSRKVFLKIAVSDLGIDPKVATEDFDVKIRNKVRRW